MNACSDELVISSVGNVSIPGVLCVSGGVTGIITANIPSIDSSNIFTHNVLPKNFIARLNHKKCIKELGTKIAQILNDLFM